MWGLVLRIASNCAADSRVVYVRRGLAGPRRPGGLDCQHWARLTALGHLWGVVKYFHPSVAFEPEQWDLASVAAIERVGAARDDCGFGEVVSQMLRSLRDPVTRIVPERRTPTVEPGPSTPSTRWEADSVLLFRVPSFLDEDDVVAYFERAAGELAAAPSVLFDQPVPVELGPSEGCIDHIRRAVEPLGRAEDLAPEAVRDHEVVSDVQAVHAQALVTWSRGYRMR